MVAVGRLPRSRGRAGTAQERPLRPPLLSRRAGGNNLATPPHALGRPVSDPVPTLEKFFAGSRPITFWLLGKPIPQGRPNHNRVSGHTYDPRRSRSWKSEAKKFFREQMQALGASPFTGPLTIYYDAIFSPPKSYPIQKKKAALAGELPYTKSPDLDNLQKIVFDAMNGIIFEDDKQVCDIHARKNYGPEDMVRVTVVEWTI